MEDSFLLACFVIIKWNLLKNIFSNQIIGEKSKAFYASFNVISVILHALYVMLNFE